MKINDLVKQLVNKATVFAKEATDKVQKDLAYFYQELRLMMPRIELIELKKIFGLEFLRVGLLVAALAVLITVPETCSAQQGTPSPSPVPSAGGLTVKSVSSNAFKTIYDDWRLPVCALLFFLAVFFYFQGGEQGLVKAIAVVVGMVVWALVPYFRDTVFSWFGQKLE